MPFDPNQIRADIETQITRLFNPSPFDPSANYDAYSSVEVDGEVWINKGALPPGVWDPAVWIKQGPVYPVLYENIVSKIPSGGAVRVLISWGTTDQKTLPCSCPAEGWAEVDGVMTLFSYTPSQEGTLQGLNATTRLRNAIPVWDQLPDISGDRPCYRVTEPNGPRASGSEAGSDFFTHNLTATLTAQDSGSPLV